MFYEKLIKIYIHTYLSHNHPTLIFSVNCTNLALNVCIFCVNVDRICKCLGLNQDLYTCIYVFHIKRWNVFAKYL